jgi:hypothetical protein
MLFMRADSMFEQVCHDDDNARRNWEKVFVSKRTRTNDHK